MYTHCVLGGFPGLHFADVLHILELSQLGQRVVTQCLVKWCVPVLVLHVELGLGPHQQLWRGKHINKTQTGSGNRSSGNNRKTTLILCYNANATVLIYKVAA